MKEPEIRKKAIRLLELKGYVCWYPKKVKYQETDVFGVYDILAARKNKVRYIQITTYPNISARRKKILGFLEKNNVKIKGSEVWGYHKSKKKFIIIKI